MNLHKKIQEEYKLRRTFVNLGEELMEKKLLFWKKKERGRKLKAGVRQIAVISVIITALGWGSVYLYGLQLKYYSQEKVPQIITFNDGKEYNELSDFVKSLVKNYSKEGSSYRFPDADSVPQQIQLIWKNILNEVKTTETLSVKTVKTSEKDRNLFKIECESPGKGRLMFTVHKSTESGYALLSIDRLKS